MKRKYYLRGLGFGILITAIVFILIGPVEMTDAEIIKRAEELGYVKAEEEATPTISLKELMGTGTPTPSPVPTMLVTPEPSLTEAPEETVTPEPTTAVETTETPVPTEVVQVTEVPTSAPTLAPTETPVPTEVPEPTNIPETAVITAEVTVARGDSAVAVCRKVEQAGIIASADELKNYIVQNGLADYINIGTYTLSSDMTYEEIARILTGR